MSASGSDHPRSCSQPTIVFEALFQVSSKHLLKSSLQKKPWLPPVSPWAFWAMIRTTSALARVAIAK